MQGVAVAFEGHPPPVENEFVPALRAVIGEEAMLELGAVYASVKENLPAGLDALPGANPDPTFRSG